MPGARCDNCYTLHGRAELVDWRVRPGHSGGLCPRARVGNCRHRRLGARLLSALGAAERSTRCQPQRCCSPGAPAVARAMRRREPGPRLTPLRRIPSGAKLRRGAPYPRHTAGLRTRRTMPRHRRPPAGTQLARRRPGESKVGLSRCHGGKSHRAKGATHWRQCKWQMGAEGRSSWSGALSASWHVAPAGHADSPTRCRSQLPAGGQVHHAAALLYFAAVPRPLNYGLRISNLAL
jgi:hypothetical protein